MSKQTQQSDPPQSFRWIAILVVALAIVAFAILNNKDQNAQEQQTSSAQQMSAAEHTLSAKAPDQETEVADKESFPMPPYLEDPDSVSLQPTLDPSVVEVAAQDGYEVARRKPKLLAQLPCFCYCDRFGHGSLHDCFVTNHAESCDICLKEALEADRMDFEGALISEIRAQIVEKYHPRKEHVH